MASCGGFGCESADASAEAASDVSGGGMRGEKRVKMAVRSASWLGGPGGAVSGQTSFALVGTGDEAKTLGGGGSRYKTRAGKSWVNTSTSKSEACSARTRAAWTTCSSSRSASSAACPVSRSSCSPMRVSAVGRSGSRAVVSRGVSPPWCSALPAALALRGGRSLITPVACQARRLNEAATRL